MLSIKNKTAFITGASSGIGKACAEQFAAAGAKVILTARRIDKIEQLATDIKQKYGVDALALQLDIQRKDQVAALIEGLPQNWQQIDILVNNAGLALSSDKIQAGDPSNWDTVINTNLNGLLYVTHAILPQMLERNSGHIVNIGSIAGHDYYPGGNIYCATKHAVKAISKCLRLDLAGTAIRVSEIDPGAVETEFSEVRWQDKNRAKEFYADFIPLVADDIADAAIYCATRPLHVDVAEMIIFPTAQASANHLSRNEGGAKGMFD
ncbi:MAG: SDR family NAD(P)-dependent oxidoreductase [Gammaproteobacteria bacterium]|nr:SDR family NAD(P)-dependent oxidoreductase [Gammaproteobacteria bacterium]